MRKLIILEHLFAQLPVYDNMQLHRRELALVLCWSCGVLWADVAKGQIDTCVVNNAWPCKLSLFNKKGRQGNCQNENATKSCTEVLISAIPYMPVAPVTTTAFTPQKRCASPPLRLGLRFTIYGIKNVRHIAVKLIIPMCLKSVYKNKENEAFCTLLLHPDSFSFLLLQGKFSQWSPEPPVVYPE